MSDALPLQSIALPDIAELQAATSCDAAMHAAPTVGDFDDDDSDWSDDCSDGRGPVLRQSIVRLQPAVLPPQDRDEPVAVCIAAAGGGSDDEQRFSAPVRAHVAHTVTAAPAAAGGEDGDCDRFGEVLRRNVYSSEADAASFPQQSPILKQGWLRKLARFGRDMRRYFIIAPLDAALLRPALHTGSWGAANPTYAVFYYAEQPQDLRAAAPCGVITMEPSSAVETLSGSGRLEHCVRLSNAQQHIRRKLHSEKRTFVLSADSHEELESWILALMQAQP